MRFSGQHTLTFKKTNGFTLALCLLVTVSISIRPAGAAEHHVVIVSHDTNDVRLPMAFDAILFWNRIATDLKLNLRLVEEVHIASPATRALENYARSISSRAGRLRSGPGEPDAPSEVTDFSANVVLLLSQQDLMSFAWPIPRGTGHFVAVESDREAMLRNPNIARNVIAHELGHTLGLTHNADPTSLMCSPCRTTELSTNDNSYMRLTDSDRKRLASRFASP